MSFHAIWDNFSFLAKKVKVNQNLKFLRWASIVIGNLRVPALQALMVLAVFINSLQPLQEFTLN